MGIIVAWQRNPRAIGSDQAGLGDFMYLCTDALNQADVLCRTRDTDLTSHMTPGDPWRIVCSAILPPLNNLSRFHYPSISVGHWALVGQ